MGGKLAIPVLARSVKVAGCSAVWLAHLVWDQGVGGSNPLTPTFLTETRLQIFIRLNDSAGSAWMPVLTSKRITSNGFTAFIR